MCLKPQRKSTIFLTQRKKSRRKEETGEENKEEDESKGKEKTTGKAGPG